MSDSTDPTEAAAQKKLVPLGSSILWCGRTARVVAVGHPGERYYWLQLEDGTVAMVPASEIEP